MRKFTLLICLFLVQFTFAQRKGYWQQKVDYKMTIDIKDDLYQYDGKMKLKYTNNSGQSLNKVYFHLYFNAFQPKSMMDYRLANIADPDKRMVDNIGTKENPKMQSRIATLGKDNIGYQKISSLTQNGKATSYKIDGTILEVTLATPIKAGKSATFDMVWEAQVPEQIRRSGRNSKEGVAYSMTQWYPKMAQFDDFGWHLDEYVGREFIAPFGNFDVTINIGKDYVIGSSGVLQNPKEVKGYDKNAKIVENNGRASWNFKATNIHDFAWAADKDFVVDEATSKGGVITDVGGTILNADVGGIVQGVGHEAVGRATGNASQAAGGILSRNVGHYGLKANGYQGYKGIAGFIANIFIGTYADNQENKLAEETSNAARDFNIMDSKNGINVIALDV